MNLNQDINAWSLKHTQKYHPPLAPSLLEEPVGQLFLLVQHRELDRRINDNVAIHMFCLTLARSFVVLSDRTECSGDFAFTS